MKRALFGCVGETALLILTVSICLHAQEFMIGTKSGEVHGFGSLGFIKTNANNWLTIKRLLCALLLAASASIFTTPARAQVIVIANPSVKASEVSKNDLKDVFTGASTSLGGANVVPILLKAGTAHQEFLQAYIGKNDTAYRAGWRSLVFSGQGTMPKTLDGDAAVVEFVAHNPGAIGYIGQSDSARGR
jgi:hypothetical protein